MVFVLLCDNTVQSTGELKSYVTLVISSFKQLCYTFAYSVQLYYNLCSYLSTFMSLCTLRYYGRTSMRNGV